VEDVRINTNPVHRLPHILNVSFKGIKGDELVRELDSRGIAISAGAACGAGTVKISHVIEALGVPREWATGTVRFSLGKANTGEEIDRVSAAVVESVTSCAGSPSWKRASAAGVPVGAPGHGAIPGSRFHSIRLLKER
jgi:cysteine desulfurase